MTTRLYYDDPYSRQFDATIVRVERRARGQAVWLDRSSFYPTSGGQPFDTGTLGDGTVVDVIDEEHDVVHVVEGGVFTVGAAVHGQLDWTRRFDHMQQHTGQHLLSAAFVRAVNVPTLSFHLGTDLSTIDLAREISPDEITKAEALANQVIWDDRPIEVRYADAADVAGMGLRKAPKLSGTLRLIDIVDFDLSACGGSHVARTGAVGVVVVTGRERCKGGVRIEFACGGRAVRQHSIRRDIVEASVRLLSVLPQEVPAAIERLQADLRQQKRLIAHGDAARAEYRATELIARAESSGATRVVVGVIDGDVGELKSIARAIVSKPGYVVVLLSAGEPTSIVAMRSTDATVECDGLVRTMCATFGGRGGGRSDFAQAGGLTGSAEKMLAEAHRLSIGAS